MSETIDGGIYLGTDGKTYHDANGNPVDKSKVEEANKVKQPEWTPTPSPVAMPNLPDTVGKDDPLVTVETVEEKPLETTETVEIVDTGTRTVIDSLRDMPDKPKAAKK